MDSYKLKTMPQFSNFFLILGWGSIIFVMTQSAYTKRKGNSQRCVATLLKMSLRLRPGVNFLNAHRQFYYAESCNNDNQFLELRRPSGKSVCLCRLGFDSESCQTNDFQIGI